MANIQYNFESKIELSIRRVNGYSLPGDDVTLHNIKIGGALHGKGPLRGLTTEEERKYLPELIGIDSTDVEFRKNVSDYWSNISAAVPADGITAEKLQGKMLSFSIFFAKEADKQAFDNAERKSTTDASTFDMKANVLKALEKTNGFQIEHEDYSDYVLFRYCLVYSRVANDFKDRKASPKIRFYLYSKQNQTKAAHILLKNRNAAKLAFINALSEPSVVDSLLIMFKQPLEVYDTIEDKHIALEGFADKQPTEFVAFSKDTQIQVKAFIRKAVAKGFIKNPANTETYYYGEQNEVKLGSTLTEAVMFLTSTEEDKVKYKNAIAAQLKNI